MEPGSITMEFTVETENDTNPERAGSFTVSVLGCTDYFVRSPSSVTVSVPDDDGVPGQPGDLASEERDGEARLECRPHRGCARPGLFLPGATLRLFRLEPRLEMGLPPDCNRPMMSLCAPYGRSSAPPARTLPSRIREEDMTATPLITIPARRGKAALVAPGQTIRVINTHGQQVVDTWAFHRADLTEFMSMEHSRTALGRIMPLVGQAMVTNHRRPILTVVEDTSGGIHDTLLAACDRFRYELLGCEGYHDNCTDNLAAALTEFGLAPPETPSPWNLFMNIPVEGDGTVSFQPPVSKPGDYVTLRAEMDCIVAFSACPQDMVPINGADCIPTEAHFQVI